LGAPTPAGQTPDAPHENTRSPERQIFDYAVELQEAALNDGGRLANPAALVGEAVEGFRKFFEKPRRVSRFPNELQTKPHDAPVVTGASTPTSEGHSSSIEGRLKRVWNQPEPTIIVRRRVKSMITASRQTD